MNKKQLTLFCIVFSGTTSLTSIGWLFEIPNLLIPKQRYIPASLDFA